MATFLLTSVYHARQTVMAEIEQFVVSRQALVHCKTTLLTLLSNMSVLPALQSYKVGENQKKRISAYFANFFRRPVLLAVQVFSQVTSTLATEKS